MEDDDDDILLSLLMVFVWYSLPDFWDFNLVSVQDKIRSLQLEGVVA